MKKIMKCLAALMLLFTTIVPFGTTAHAEEIVEINFMIPDWGAPSEELLKEFEEQSGIKVNVLPTAWDDIRDKLAIAAAGNTVAADVFEVDWSWVGEFVNAGWLAPIELEDADDFPALSQFAVDETVYGVPYANDFRIGYYNKRMFNEGEVDEDVTSWDKVIETAKTLKEAGVVEYPVSIPIEAGENTTTTFLWLALSRNGVVFNEDGTLNAEAALDALTVYEELMMNELVDLGNVNSSGYDSFMPIVNGDAAFVVGPSGLLQMVEGEDSAVKGEIETALLPGKETTSPVTASFQEGVGISPNTEHPDAALEFVKWYTSPETQARLFDELGSLPTRISVLEKVVEEGKINNADVMLELAGMIESPFPHGVPAYYTEMSAEIYNIINQLATGKLTAEEAAEQMVENVNKVVEANK